MDKRMARIAKAAAIGGAFAALIIFFGDLAADGLRILFGAGVICFLVSPIERLIAKKLGRPWSAIIALGIAALVVLGLFAAVIPMTIDQIGRSGSAITNAADRISALVQDAEQALKARLPRITIPDMDLSGAEGNIAQVLGSAADYLGSLAGGMYRVLLSVALSFFFLADRDRTLIRMELIVPERIRRHAVRFGHELMHELRLYVRGQLTIALAVGALACLGLIALGVPNAIILGLIVGIFNIIPYFGPVLGGIPAVLMAVGIGWNRALLTIAMLFAVQQVDGLIISPRVMGTVTGFSPGTVLLALYFGSRISGIWGLLLAMPALMTYRTLYRVFVQRYEMN